ncbi:hypothetical protein MSIM_53490 [Mycobacterium simiae]|nr:hypothetical protein MSIM_53490 [Mycobacterium simiae]
MAAKLPWVLGSGVITPTLALIAAFFERDVAVAAAAPATKSGGQRASIRQRGKSRLTGTRETLGMRLIGARCDSERRLTRLTRPPDKLRCAAT